MTNNDVWSNEMTLELAASMEREAHTHDLDSTMGTQPTLNIETTKISPKSKQKKKVIKKSQSDILLTRQNSALPDAAAQSLFEWRGISVYVGTGKKRKQILHDFNGSIQSGKLLAVMGGTVSMEGDDG